jgi:DNA-binding LytR/AlgR family response regulator
MAQDAVFKERSSLYYLLRRCIRMRLAICDDDVGLVKRLKPLVYQYANDNRFEMVIDELYSGEALLESKTKYDMIFLDYQMGGINGMEAARKLRERNINCTIVFMTNYPHFVYEAFEVNTFRFCEKPFEQTRIYEVLDDYFAMYGNDYPILLKFDRETIKVHTGEIVCIEAMRKQSMISLPKDQIRIAKHLAAIIPLLPKSHFFRVNRSFIINFNYIAKYDNEFVYMKNGAKVPQSRKNLADFKAEYFAYVDTRNPKRKERQPV